MNEHPYPPVAGDAEAPSEPPSPDPAPWGLGGAVLVPTLSFGGQLLLAILMGGIAGLGLILLDPTLAEDAEALSRMVILVSVLPVALASSLWTLALVYVSVTLICRRSFLAALRIRRPSPITVLFLLAGLAAALFSIGLAGLFPPEDPEEAGGPLTELARSGALGHAIWILLAVVVAPVVEEILFRGYAYLGARARLGPAGAGAGVTLLFVTMHMTETGLYWPALVGIGTMAVLLVLIVEMTDNLTHCIACHLGYNGSLVLLSLLQGVH